MDSTLIGVILFNCVLMLGIAWYYKKYPPKKISEFYGFRTRRTMANQDIWDKTNKRNAQDMWTYAVYLSIISIVLIVFNIPYAIIIHIAVTLIGVFVVIFATI